MTLPRRSPPFIINTRVCFIWLNHAFPCCCCSSSSASWLPITGASLPLPEQADYYPTARDINPSPLTDGDEPFTPANLTGHWTFLFLGYTYCPDICPTTLAGPARRLPWLEENRPNSQVVFISAIPSGMTAPVSRAIPPSSSPSSRRRPHPTAPCSPWCATWAWSIPSWRANARIT